jgi:nucleoside transporter
MSDAHASGGGVDTGSAGGAVKLRLSLMMFLQYAIWGAWLPILYPFLMGHREFSLDETGTVLAAGAVGAILGPFIAGQLADRLFATEKLLAASHLLGAILVWFLADVSDFTTFAVLSLLYGLIYAPTLALTNSLAFHHLPNRDRDFGPVRLWGTIGWIASGILVGQMLLRFHTPAEGTAAAIAAAQDAGRADAFRLSSILGVVMALFSLTLPHTPPTKRGGEKLAWAQALREIAKPPLLVLFLLAVPMSMVHQFYFVHTSSFLTAIQNENAGAGRFADLINQVFGVGGGGLMTIGQMAEIAVLAVMPFLATRCSRKALLGIGIAAYAARMAIFAFAPSFVPALIGVALHGLCFGCFVFVAFMVVDQYTSKEVRATAQNLFNLVLIGIGIIVGSWFATSIAVRIATDEAGNLNNQTLFAIPMLISILCLVVLAIAYRTPAREASDAR